MSIRFSIITIVFNDVLGIEKTIKSVIKQNCSNFEYIIIDGYSTDGTAEIIKKYSDYITYYVSEKDNGISDAFNKGIAKAQGEWLCFLNAGDIFVSSETLNNVEALKMLDKRKSLIFYGKAFLENAKHKRLYSGEPFTKKRFEKAMIICHQSAFMHRDYFKLYGLYDLNFKLTMDYELLLRSKEFNYVFFNIVISRIEDGGISRQNIKNVYKEFLLAKLMHVKKCKYILYYEFLVHYFIVYPMSNIYLFIKHKQND